MVPQRIQLRRTKGWRKPEGAVVVSRPSKYGNPFKVGGPLGGWVHEGSSLWRSSGRIESVEHAVDHYRQYIGIHFVPVDPSAKPHKGIYTLGIESIRAQAQRELGGKDLACWCPLDQPCHGDVLLELANR